MSKPIVGGQFWVEHPLQLQSFEIWRSTPGSTSWIDHAPGHLFDFAEFREVLAFFSDDKKRYLEIGVAMGDNAIIIIIIGISIGI